MLDSVTLSFILKEIQKIKKEQELETNIMNKILALLSDKNAAKVV